MTSSPAANLALALLPPLTLVVFALLRPAIAAATVLLASVMFMPERASFDPPGLPSLNKLSIAGACALIGCVATSGTVLRRARPGRGIDVLAVIACVGSFATAAMNPDPLVYGPLVLPGLTLYDGLSSMIRLLLASLVPFFLGRALFRTSRELHGLMTLLVVCGLIYVPLVLVEVRLSPQLHSWVYGYRQQVWDTAVRGGGYRPMGFMAAGLALAMFMLSAMLAAFALAHAKARFAGYSAAVPAVVLAIAFVLCKSTGAIVYGVALGPLVLWAKAKRSLQFSVVVSVLVAVYPMLRATGLFPTEELVAISAQVSAERAQSLKFRFDNEDKLAEKALERVWVGWGGWGRSRVYDSIDGRDSSVTDGAWIIEYGSSGAVGWGSLLGLLLGPVIGAARHIAQVQSKQDRTLLSALGLIVVVNAVDLLPNGLFSYLPLFFSGCLAGLVSGMTKARPLTPPRPSRSGLGHGRQGSVGRNVTSRDLG